MKVIDLTGRRFGRLVAVQPTSGRKGGGGLIWRCRCDCGRYALVRSYLLRSAGTTSCGCYAQEIRKLTHNKTHGQSRTREYNSWCHMHRRCNNPRDAAYHNYGGRGIKVCKRWMKLENFMADMGPCPPGLTLERKNNNNNYTPSNCKWATYQEQAFNRRPYKLTKADIRRILRLAASGVRQAIIAARFGVHQSHVSNIVRQKRQKKRVTI